MSRLLRRKLRGELREANARIKELEQHVSYGLNLIDGGPLSPDQRAIRRNGLLTDSARYLAGRVDKRRSRKKLEKEIAKEAVAKARVEAARKKFALK